MSRTQPTLFEKIANTLSTLQIEGISQDRNERLMPLINYIQSGANDKREIRLCFVCTHNSRRSIMAQTWAQALAYHFGLKVFCSYSAGTESTALFPKVADTLADSGFEVQAISKGSNPVYNIKYAENAHPVVGFSKTLDAPFNPKSGLAAVMTCSEADEACPFIAGADKRISLPYNDPKIYDDSPQQSEAYKERNWQIAAELHYVFSRINA